MFDDQLVEELLNSKTRVLSSDKASPKVNGPFNGSYVIHDYDFTNSIALKPEDIDALVELVRADRNEAGR